MEKSSPAFFLLLGTLLLLPLSGNIGAWGQRESPGEEQRRAAPQKTTAPGTPEEKEAFPEGILSIRGKVRLVGNMPFPRLVITDESNRDWYLEGPDRDLLAAYEQRSLGVSGRAEYQDIILANGVKAGVRRFLRDIRVIETP
ncbi:MAG: hypothetical protein LBT95_07700 [Treponema sp.]|jgi:hypothetical protein|nr:hypothetical protein [Treponema sp.]